MSPGEHTLELVQEGGGQLPWSIAVKSNRVKPENSPETKVGARGGALEGGRSPRATWSRRRRG